ncbi:glutaminase [Pseudanabaena sp. FACHB-1998]|uniref:glutaminase n=1 Tax=Pseudanabaena sp. FACHB-1998 TaxID=2692858 RepID=UPI0016810824|nr:glutaminase [Pseudanabaena sp. FACHB-1998]MBD2175663.1 glutaminase [Pseudanabaena sp. FACHB-1998]
MREKNLPLWLELAKQETPKGKLPSYIPLLAQVDPQAIAIAIHHPQASKSEAAGDITLTFPLMSVIKPFLLLYLLETMGFEQVFRLVDRLPSQEAFNAIPEGKPRNPMLNSGAIALSSLLASSKILQNWLNHRSNASLYLDQAMLDSVRSVVNRRNLAIADRLQALGLISNPEQALAVYEEICCLRGNVEDLAKIGVLLVDTQRSAYIPIVLEIMTKCGMYAASEEFAQDIGLPSKSSVSGAILSVVPDVAAIACYSPALDAIGNSVGSLFLIHQLVAQS